MSTEPTAPARALPGDADAEKPTIAVLTVRPDRAVHPVTGEPRRPWSIWAAVALSYLGVATVVVGMLLAFYASKDIDRFAGATWLNGVVETEPGSLIRIAMVTGLFTVTMAIAAGALIAGYHAWRGHSWTRIASLVAIGVGVLSLLGNVWMIASLLPIALAAGAIWLPSSKAFFDAWHARRHPTLERRAAGADIFYGPLPRYVA